MKRKTKLFFGISIWLGIGLFSTIFGWEHFVTYVIGVYTYLTFVLPFEKEELE